MAPRMPPSRSCSGETGTARGSTDSRPSPTPGMGNSESVLGYVLLAYR